MATRSTGFGLIASNSAQEVMDLALIAQAATLESRVPFIHFFDGFRTSHEVKKIEQLSVDDMKAMIDDDLVLEHRKRALSPDNPAMRGTAQSGCLSGRETQILIIYNALTLFKTNGKFAKLGWKAISFE
jgi:pyruvate-ferredoxin/flavodoxin oxidoreductase